MSALEALSVKEKNPTRTAYVMTRILDTPFWSLYNLLPIFLFKDLHATPYQLGLLITLKPLVSLLSSYWSTKVQQCPNKILSSITLGRFLAYLPFLFFPFIDSIWYFIFCFGLYMLLQVGMVPAWMELLKQNLPAETRDKVFSYTQVFGYLGGGLLPFVLGWILDEWSGSWRWMFPITAIIAWGAYFWQKFIVVNPIKTLENEGKRPHPLLHPWKNTWELLKKRPDFANFQIGFMLIGCGLMIIQPTLPVFFVDRLNLNFTEMGVAIMLCKGIGFACSSSLWVRWIQRVNFFQFGAVIASLAVLFPFFLIAAQYQIVWLYLAYLIYGFMQSGNELSWNMSGPKFASHENSAPYSTVNVISVGVRGLFIPFIGAFCLEHFGSLSVIFLSGILCLMAAIKMALYSRAKVSPPLSNQ
jgi:MFS family permease